MENEMQGGVENMLEQLTARLTAAVELLERAVPKLSAEAGVGPIVAMVERNAHEEGGREAELVARLEAAEKTIAELKASVSSGGTGRKTLPVSLLAKQEGAAVEAGALDAALGSLSMEQRIAVKSQLLRAGLV